MNIIRAIFFISLCSCASTKFQKQLIAFEQECQDHLGVLIYDPIRDKTLIDYNSDKYFTPASNTKILTFYASMQLLRESIPSLYYKEIGDTLVIWGTGNPSFLYDPFQDSTTFDFLKNSYKEIYFSDVNFMDDKLGMGWSWEDLELSWSAEKSSFPIYGNSFKVKKIANQKELEVKPKFFESFIIEEDSASKTKLFRELGSNNYKYQPGPDSLNKKFSFGISGQLIADLLYDTLDRKVNYAKIPLSKPYSTLQNYNSKEVLTEMMRESDNMIAEQLLLIISGLSTDTLNTKIAIENIINQYLIKMPDQPKWVDGSGLSRYNAITPRSLVWILNELYNSFGKEVLEYFPIGGQSGTLENYFKEEKPYIFAKTGTMTKHHNLSGYMITKKGRLYIFSFMNNNYTTLSYPVKRKMEELLHEFYLNN